VQLSVLVPQCLPMAAVVVLGTDGSDLASRALAAGCSVLRPIDRAIVVTVIEDLDPMLITDAGGHAGPTLGPTSSRGCRRRRARMGRCVRAAAETLRIDNVDSRPRRAPRPQPLLVCGGGNRQRDRARNPGTGPDHARSPRICGGLRRPQRSVSCARHRREGVRAGSLRLIGSEPRGCRRQGASRRLQAVARRSRSAECLRCDRATVTLGSL
jgi:hypothetical protein